MLRSENHLVAAPNATLAYVPVEPPFHAFARGAESERELKRALLSVPWPHGLMDCMVFTS